MFRAKPKKEIITMHLIINYCYNFLFWVSPETLVCTKTTIWCLVKGSTSAFKVTVGTDNDLSDLKKLRNRTTSLMLTPTSSFYGVSTPVRMKLSLLLIR